MEKSKNSTANAFISLGISAHLVKGLKEMGISVPTAVQKEVIPAVFRQKNLLVQSPTGTGKTLAYLLPLLEKINPETKEAEVLILVPSRELSFQVTRVIKELTGELALSVASLVGGVNVTRQLTALKEKPKIIVGTPGRVLELFHKRKINGQVLQTLVVDEIDKMLTLGFMGDVRAIFQKTLKTRQVLLFSATIPPELYNKVPEMTEQPELITINGAGSTPATIKHLYFLCDKAKKSMTLQRLLRILRPQKAMVFLARNEGVMSLTGQLAAKGYKAAGLHSDLSQLHRKNLLNAFREGKESVLVTTDLLARGLDVAGVDYIINYDLPVDAPHYLHRAGRTGRAGKTGTAVTLVSVNQKYLLHRIAAALAINMEEMGLDGEKVFPVKYRRKKETRG